MSNLTVSLPEDVFSEFKKNCSDYNISVDQEIYALICGFNNVFKKLHSDPADKILSKG